MNSADLSLRQSASARQGSAFEETVVTLLQVEGWQVIDRKWRHPVIDVEIDIVAKDPFGVEWWIECKGSWESTRNGLERTDTLKKAIANGALIRLLDDHDRKPYMVVASHLPREESAGERWLQLGIGQYVDEVRLVGFTARNKAEATEVLF